MREVINDQNVKLQISPKREQIHSAYRLKKFINPKSSKFLDEGKLKEESKEGQETEFNTPELTQNKNDLSNKLIKNSIEQRITRSMAKQNKEKQSAQAIAVINNLIIPDSVKYKLKVIARKIYQSEKLTHEETSFWNSFPNSEKSYMLTGDTATPLDFTEYQHSTFCCEQQQILQPEEAAQWENHNLFFDPSSSDTDSSEDPDERLVPPTRTTSHTDDSWPDNSNSNLFNQPSTSGQLSKTPSNQELDHDSDTNSCDTNLSPQELTNKTKSSKGFIDSWKNTAQTLWKPPSKVKITPDPSAISTRTRSKNTQNEPENMASHPHDLNIDSVCGDKNRSKQTKPSGGVQANWQLCHQCALPSHPNSSKFGQNHKHTKESYGPH